MDLSQLMNFRIVVVDIMDNDNLKTRIKKAVEEGSPRVVHKGTEEEWDGEKSWSKRLRSEVHSEHIPRTMDLQIIETRPSFRTTKILLCNCNDLDLGHRCYCVPHRYRLAMPYMQYHFLKYPHSNLGRANRCRITWSFESLNDCEQLVSLPLLPNIYSGYGHCCLQKPRSKGRDSAISVCEQFWNAAFTPNEANWYYKGRIGKTTLKSFAHWHLLSSEASEPMEVFEGFTPPSEFQCRHGSITKPWI